MSKHASWRVGRSLLIVGAIIALTALFTFAFFVQPKKDVLDGSVEVTAQEVLDGFLEAFRESNTAALPYVSPLEGKSNRELLITFTEDERKNLIEALEGAEFVQTIGNASEFSLEVGGYAGVIYVYTNAEDRGVVF